MKIHYFQRYHAKENVATANTMLLLSRLYQYSTDKFFRFLNSWAFPEGFESEIVFQLQEKNDKSVLDATITQDSFKIAVETHERLHAGTAPAVLPGAGRVSAGRGYREHPTGGAGLPQSDAAAQAHASGGQSESAERRNLPGQFHRRVQTGLGTEQGTGGGRSVLLR